MYVKPRIRAQYQLIEEGSAWWLATILFEQGVYVDAGGELTVAFG